MAETLHEKTHQVNFRESAEYDKYKKDNKPIVKLVDK
jgi:hypothetical protein